MIIIQMLIGVYVGIAAWGAYLIFKHPGMDKTNIFLAACTVMNAVFAISLYRHFTKRRKSRNEVSTTDIIIPLVTRKEEIPEPTDLDNAKTVEFRAVKDINEDENG